MKALIALLLVCTPAFAAVPASGLRCVGHGAANRAALNALMHQSAIQHTYYGSQGGFGFDGGTLELRTRNGFATYCVDGATDLSSDAVCAPWGNAARVLYTHKAPRAGLGLLQVLDAGISPSDDILLDCREI